ncbi:MAG TPA: HD domain-containing phosphohydrolase [Candidatus Angelobacter sp.]|jgi:putative two-component system response regulator|nr:HD domain-containing phosphohydrolase [Candidatus Angelobacter sp.]
MSRILVAEDDPLVSRYLIRCLDSGGYEAEVADDGVRAIAKLAGGGWDCVITDHFMPRASGLEVIAAARRLDPTLPCVVVTAMNDMELAVSAMAEGAVGFIPKPFRPDQLLVVVRNALERRRLAVESTRMRLLGPLLEKFAMILANTLEAKDLSTHLHCERLVEYADSVATCLRLAPEESEALRLGACLHDIGKIGVPDVLLQKANGLDEEEWLVLRRHAEIGAAILADIEGWGEVRRVVRHHHERYDGNGYPDRLRGMMIPLGARVVSVVDAYDVMTAGRPYSPPRPAEQAMEELIRQRGSQFDPDVVDAFLEVLERNPPAQLIGRDALRVRGLTR